MDTIVAVETTIAEVALEGKAVEVVDLVLSDLDVVGGGAVIGYLD